MTTIRRISLSAIVALAMTGCASVNYVMDTYGDVKLAHFTTAGGETFRVFDRPDQSRLMITESMSVGLARGLARGATLGLTASAGPGMKYENAALEFLSASGRACTVRRNSMILKAQFEIEYLCALREAAP